MNLYGVIALIFLLVVLGFSFDLAPAFKQFAQGIADIPKFTHTGRNPALYAFAIRLAYLIAIIGVLKIIFRRKGDDS